MGLREIAAQQRSRSAVSSEPRESAKYDPLADLRAGIWPGLAAFTAHSLHYDQVIEAWSTNSRGQHYEPENEFSTCQQFALHCWRNGWSVFPENFSREPAFLKWDMSSAMGRGRARERENWLQVKPSQQRDTPATWLTVFTYTERASRFNLACVAGAASSNVRAVDIDCLDEQLSEQIKSIAFEVFGPTPFIRIGRAPKQLLIYRAEDKSQVAQKSYTFALEDGEADPENALEILGSGHNFTLYGHHHKTLKPFDWSRGTLHPAIASPMEAPAITDEQVNQFVRRVNDVRKIRFNATAGSNPFGGDASFRAFERSAGGNYWIPRLSDASGHWTLNGDGQVVDGRESYLQRAAWAVVGANIMSIMTDDGPAAQGLLDAFLEHVDAKVVSDGKRTAGQLSNEATTKFRSSLTKFTASVEQYRRTGEFDKFAIPRQILADGRAPSAQHIPAADRPADWSWLPAPADLGIERAKNKKVLIATKAREQLATDKAARALVTDADQLRSDLDDVADQIRAAGDEFLSKIVPVDGNDQLPALYVLKAPTGSGKTTAVAVGAVGEWCKNHPRQRGEGPVVVCFPTHANIQEATAVAETFGMTVPKTEFEERSVVRDLRANGVKVATMRGKIAAGCQRADEIRALRDAGIGASNLCGAKVDEDSELVAAAKRRDGEKVEKVEVLCPIRAAGNCGYWNQMREIETADIVFVPHSYLTMANVPTVIKHARAVIIDETITYRVLHQMRMRVDVLDRPRPEPRPTKSELAEGGTAEEIGSRMLASRDSLVVTVKKAFAAWICPATAIRDAGQSELVADAIKVVARAHLDEWKINPNMSREAILAMASKRDKAGYLIEEEKFWRIVADRLELLDAGTARGDREVRLQLVEITDPVDGLIHAVRLSWRSEPNWVESPMLLLDASASPEITEKVFGRPANVINVDASARMRTIAVIDDTFSNRAFMPPPDAPDESVKKALKLTDDVRTLIDKVSFIYSHSRVLLTSTAAVRQHLVKSDDWSPNENVDDTHFGALRGRDFAKFHAVALTVGRSEQPIHVNDGYAAALGYDDKNPELPYDVFGTGYADAERTKPLFRVPTERVITMRTGHDVSHWVREIPRRWGAIVDAQWTDEELYQTAGRLRPVYRGVDDVPTWICVTKSLPRNVVVDEVITLEDLVSDREAWNLMKLGGDMLDLKPLKDHAIVKAITGGTDEGWYKLVQRLERNPGIKQFRRSQHVVRVIEDDGSRRHVYLPGWVEHPLDFVSKAMPARALQIATPVETPLDRRAKAKTADWMDLEFADSASDIAVPASEPEIPRTLPPPTNRNRSPNTPASLGWVEYHGDAKLEYRGDGTLSSEETPDWYRKFGPDGVTVTFQGDPPEIIVVPPDFWSSTALLVASTRPKIRSCSISRLNSTL